MTMPLPAPQTPPQRPVSDARRGRVPSPQSAKAAARNRLRAAMAPGDGRGWRKFWHRVACSHCFGSGGGPEHLMCDWCHGKGDVWERNR